jgi:hypothetical protein
MSAVTMPACDAVEGTDVLLAPEGWQEGEVGEGLVWLGRTLTTSFWLSATVPQGVESEWF